MGRKIIMTGKNARYIEHRGANGTPDTDREIRLEGEEAVYQEEHDQDKVVDAIHELTDVVKKSLEEPRTQIYKTFEFVEKKETNIDTNYGPNIEHNGGTLTLPEGKEATAPAKLDDDKQ